MLHPVGPLPASVYWRRRVLAFAGGTAVIVLLGSLLGGGGGGTPAGASSSTSTSPAATGSDLPTGSSSASDTPLPVGQSGVGETDQAAGTDTAEPTATAATAATTSSPPPTAAPPAPCQDTALRLTVRPAAAAYRVGDEPVIRLTVQNISATTCTRDLGAAQQEVLLYSGTTRLWSSNDCYPGGQQHTQALLPREDATFSVTWSGLSSRPGCTGIRTRVGPGRYQLVGRLGTLRSPPATLTLR